MTNLVLLTRPLFFDLPIWSSQSDCGQCIDSIDCAVPQRPS
ncbi:hypothetical protein [Acinetobacter modestus]